jgi:hypothetical protein
MEGFCDDAKLPLREVPLKSGLRQLQISNRFKKGSMMDGR